MAAPIAASFTTSSVFSWVDFSAAWLQASTTACDGTLGRAAAAGRGGAGGCGAAAATGGGAGAGCTAATGAAV